PPRLPPHRLGVREPVPDPQLTAYLLLVGALPRDRTRRDAVHEPVRDLGAQVGASMHSPPETLPRDLLERRQRHRAHFLQRGQPRPPLPSARGRSASAISSGSKYGWLATRAAYLTAFNGALK